MNDLELRDIYSNEFEPLLEGDWAPWRARYLAQVSRVQGADLDTWLRPDFQESLWDEDAVASVGPGRSVTVEGAYGDAALARLLLEGRDSIPKLPLEERGAALLSLYETTLAAVQAYNKRRPKARLLRLLATLFPADVSCVIEDRKLWQVLRLVGVRSSKAEFISQHPVLRQRLREIIATPAALAADVDQSIFSWFLWERYCAKPDEGAVVISPAAKVATDAPVLSLMPATVQRKGLMHVRENISLLVAIVREAEQGITRPDLIAAIQREAPHLKAQGSAANIISQAQGGLALITVSDGAYRPTDHGLELLTNPSAAQVLQPLLIGRIFGMGHLLLSLKEQPNGVERKELSAQLSALIPTRTSQWSGSELIQWACASRLAQPDGSKVVLTEEGAAYADALPANFRDEWKIEAPAEVSGLEPDAEDSGPTRSRRVSAAEFVPAEWQVFRARFEDGDLSSRLILPEDFLAELHAALHATGRKRFVLLSGLSGTGKTSIARAYAEAYSRASGLTDWEQRYAQVAVRPDWTDPTGLLGFVNSIADPPTFQAAEALHLLLAADGDRGRPYFLCLDEMNLARVEHYFAPFLSAMEGPRGTLALHGEMDAIDNVEPRIDWPSNLFIFGTVNMDESTHAFSDKVLDRAFTFEFWDVDLDTWEARQRAGGAHAEVIDAVAPHLKAMYRALYGARRHFGYRTADEVLAYCTAGSKALSIGALLDGATLMKILPRVRGDDSGALEQALAALLEVAAVDRLPRTAAKVRLMIENLKTTGQARFWS